MFAERQLSYRRSDAVLLCVQIQNLGLFSVQDVLFRADIWAVTMRGNQLLNITDFSIEQVTLEIFKL